MLLKPETSRRLAKSAIEWEEHNISYHPCTNIKVQVLAEFILEILGEVKASIQKKELLGIRRPKDGQRWTLYTNRSSSKEGSGEGLILTSPEGEEITYTLRFNFHTSNNEAEYEALLAGLSLTRQMGADIITAVADSWLAAN